MMVPFEHAYTNSTEGDGRVVVKRYRGPDAAGRRSREQMALEQLAGIIAVPEVLDGADRWLRTSFVSGAHGKDLIGAGLAEPVLAACGDVLKQIHSIDPERVFGRAEDASKVVVHGDFGPNNVLLNDTTMRIAAVVDWEWAHPGDPVEDVAWCEWIVRTHHPAAVDSLAAFFVAYGQRPAWPNRHAAMVTKCTQLLDFALTHDPHSPTAATRSELLAATQGWQESP